MIIKYTDGQQVKEVKTDYVFFPIGLPAILKYFDHNEITITIYLQNVMSITTN